MRMKLKKLKKQTLDDDNFMHAQTPPRLWADCSKCLHVWWGRRLNQGCKIQGSWARRPGTDRSSPLQKCQLSTVVLHCDTSPMVQLHNPYSKTSGKSKRWVYRVTVWSKRCWLWLRIDPTPFPPPQKTNTAPTKLLYVPCDFDRTAKNWAEVTWDEVLASSSWQACNISVDSRSRLLLCTWLSSTDDVCHWRVSAAIWRLDVLLYILLPEDSCCNGTERAHIKSIHISESQTTTKSLIWYYICHFLYIIWLIFWWPRDDATCILVIQTTSMLPWSVIITCGSSSFGCYCDVVSELVTVTSELFFQRLQRHHSSSNRRPCQHCYRSVRSVRATQQLDSIRADRMYGHDVSEKTANYSIPPVHACEISTNFYNNWKDCSGIINP